MSISIKDLDILRDKVIYNTNDEKYVLSEQYQKIITDPDYQILGFLNGYMYSCISGCLRKSTLQGEKISDVSLDVDHGAFFEGLNYMYFYKDKSVYKVDSNLNILWSKTFDDYVQSVSVDMYGSIYVIYENSMTIRKFLNDGTRLLYLSDSEDVTKMCRLYKIFITPGSGYIYALGSQFYDNKVDSFIDKYDTRKGERISRDILCSAVNVIEDDPYYQYHNLIVDGDYMYIYANQYIQKINIKMFSIWKYDFGFNNVTKLYNKLANIEFDDTGYEEYIYFSEDLFETNGHSIGKLNINGNLLWKCAFDESLDESNFQVCIYKGDIYNVTKRNVDIKSSKILSLDDNKTLFETRDGKLIKIIEDYSDIIYSPEYYAGSYLLADSLSNPVNKFADIPLMHDIGPIVDENGNPLLLTIENSSALNPDNYDYARLIASTLSSVENAKSILTSLEGMHIRTLDGSRIKSLVPYQPLESVEYITNTTGDCLNTMQSENIARLASHYDYARYIIADRHMYNTHIVTKQTKFRILTKKSKKRLTRKIKSVYSYLLQKLNDIDIIVEFLKENDITRTLIPHYVDRLRHHTTHMIQDMQVANTPTYHDLNSMRKFSYWYDGYEYPIITLNTQVYMCKNIPFVRKRRNKSILIDSMANMVKNEEVKPFMVFINGKAIKWSNMVIIRDWFYSYILINNIREQNCKMEGIVFPSCVRYGEDNNTIPLNKNYMYFNELGQYTTNKDEIAIRIEILDPTLSSSDQIINDENKYIKVNTPQDNQLADGKNIFVFENGLLYGESRFYMRPYGKNIFTYRKDNIEDIKVKTFYFDQANDSKNMLFKLPNQEKVEQDIIDRIDHPQNNQYIDNFSVPFDFSMSRKKTYETNIAEATKYIMSYDMSLLANYYKDQANMSSMIFTGQRLMDIMPPTGFISMPRQRKNGLDDYIVVFKNNELYEYYYQTEYKNNVFRVPIFNHVKRDDIIEILHFKNVNNEYHTLTVTTDKDDYIEDSLRYDNFLLFGNSPSGSDIYDDFNVENNVQYEIPFEYKNNYNNGGKYMNTTFKLDDTYYMNKKINIASKRQFQYMYYNVFQNRSLFNLSPDFRYCQNKSQYMIFVNRVRLDSDKWDLHVMSSSSPLEYINITTVDELVSGDRIEIIYIPDSYEEIILPDYQSVNGSVILDREILDYSFDKDLFLVFADGSKINYGNIENISNNQIRIKTELNRSTMTICRFLQPDKLLKEVFSYGDIWSNSVDSLTNDEYKKLFIKSGVIKK